MAIFIREGALARGAFEILIKLVKRTLKKILGQALLTYEELLTVVTDVESTVNCRPITYVYLDERVEPLTPSHLITGKRIISLLSIVEEDQYQEIDLGELLNGRLTYVSTLLKHYWNLFIKEYLPSLREYHRCTQEGGKQRKPETGEVVIVHKENTSRQCWKLGRITEVHRSTDRARRGVTLKVVTKSGKVHKLRRPVQKIFPLQVLDKPEQTTQVKSDSQKPEVKSEVKERQPRRVA